MNVLAKINKSIPELIYKLKVLEQDFSFLNQNEINAKTLLNKLKIPNAHLKFLFKYHCKLSIHEYLKKALSIQLISQGFLNGQTIDSLNACHFDSKITFIRIQLE